MAVTDASLPGAPTRPTVQAPGWLRAGFQKDWKAAILVLGVGLLVLALAMGLALSFGRPVNPAGAAAAAGVLTLATAVAIGIERILEVWWTAIDLIAPNPRLPFANLALQLDDLTHKVTAATLDALDAAAKDSQSVTGVVDGLPATLGNAQQEIAQLQAAVRAVQSDARAQSVGPGLEALKARLDTVSSLLASSTTKGSLQAAALGVEGLSSFISSIARDPNPGRRIMSLFLGAYLGLAAATLFGLDVISAVLGYGTTWHVGLAITGVVIGLGATPIHSLISAVQAFKQAQG